MTDRQSLNDALEVFFRLRPNTWIDGKVLAEVAGGYAWRSRCSDLRKRGMTIENRLRRVREHAANCPALQSDVPRSCWCSDLHRYTISEYRYVPSESVTVRVEDNGQAAFI